MLVSSRQFRGLCLWVCVPDGVFDAFCQYSKYFKYVTYEGFQTVRDQRFSDVGYFLRMPCRNVALFVLVVCSDREQKHLPGKVLI